MNLCCSFLWQLVSWVLLQGMRTYDYIMAMREENQFKELDPFDDSDSSSDESSDFDSPERSTFVSRFMCRGLRVNQVIGHSMFLYSILGGI